MDLEYLLQNRSWQGNHYNCANFAAEAYCLITGEKILHILKPLNPRPQKRFWDSFEFTTDDEEFPETGLVLMDGVRGEFHVAAFKGYDMYHMTYEGPLKEDLYEASKVYWDFRCMRRKQTCGLKKSLNGSTTGKPGIAHTSPAQYGNMRPEMTSPLYCFH